MSCPQCSKLSRELAGAREMLGLLDGDVAADVIRRRFKLSLMDARILMRLYAAAGRPVQFWALEQELQVESRAGLKVHISHIRRSLGGDFVETARDVGYRLSPVGRARIYQAINERREVACAS
ncbi:hypothetical protein [Phenylobacterium sp.]|uniref:hypothetical protein n=1 Tax=Phenylobacterium sp. TaxID=1871053 RepID=UPI0027311C32|nr:hypothetical protein [Phenylobacterium sp.]MDP1598994.1 hypothetical protein [Phenylobacterium sp.]MDP3590422.1 hypothetical protein [Phenylobacterium sp.]